MSDANKYGRSVQCWPSGRMLEVIGDPPTEIRERTADGWGEWRTPTPAELWTVKVQDTAARILAQDVYHVDSCLVDDLLKHSDELPGDLGQEWNWENVRGLTVDPDGWDLEQCREYLEDHGESYPDPNPWEMDRAGRLELLEAAAITFDSEQTPQATDDELLAECVRVINDEGAEGIDDWRDAVREHSQDNPPDVYEWYRVSPWLLGQLAAIGEATLDNAYGEWWGRTCTGQGVIMDGTFQKIAANLHDDEKPKDETAAG